MQVDPDNMEVAVTQYANVATVTATATATPFKTVTAKFKCDDFRGCIEVCDAALRIKPRHYDASRMFIWMLRMDACRMERRCDAVRQLCSTTIVLDQDDQGIKQQLRNAKIEKKKKKNGDGGVGGGGDGGSDSGGGSGSGSGSGGGSGSGVESLDVAFTVTRNRDAVATAEQEAAAVAAAGAARAARMNIEGGKKVHKEAELPDVADMDAHEQEAAAVPAAVPALSSKSLGKRKAVD